MMDTSLIIGGLAIKWDFEKSGGLRTCHVFRRDFQKEGITYFRGYPFRSVVSNIGVPKSKYSVEKLIPRLWAHI